MKLTLKPILSKPILVLDGWKNSFSPRLYRYQGKSCMIMSNDNNALYYNSSDDEGQTWGKPKRLMNGWGNSWAPSVYTYQGKVCMIMSNDNNALYYNSSNDGGQTWGKPKRLMNGWGNSWTPTIFEEKEQMHMIMSGDSGQLYFTSSSDGGKNWLFPSLLLGGWESPFPPAILQGDETKQNLLVIPGKDPGNGSFYSANLELTRPLVSLDLNKKYSDICFAMAHDSHTALQDYEDADNVPEWADQTQLVSRQLLGGIRTVRISTGTPHNSTFADLKLPPKFALPLRKSLLLNPKQIIVQHTLMLGFFKDYLTQVISFLRAEPNEIVTIIDEGDETSSSTYGDWTRKAFFEAVAEVYVSLMGGTKDQPGSGNLKAYVPKEKGVWLSLQEMINSGERLVVFSSTPQNGTSYKWILPAYEPSGSIGTNTAENIFGNNPNGYLKAYKSTSRWPKNPAELPPLYLINHYFVKSLPFRTESSRAYSYLSVGNTLVRDVLYAWKKLNKKPNFINVDFYQGVDGATSFLIPLVNSMNKFDTPEEVEKDLKENYNYAPPALSVV